MKTKSILALLCFVLQFTAVQVNGQWVRMTTQYSQNVFSLAQEGAKVYAGMDSCVYISSDSGTTWIARNLSGSPVKALLVEGELVLAGTGDGVFATTDSGGTWSQAGLADTSVTAICKLGELQFAGTAGFGVLETTNGGAVWAPAGLSGANIAALVVSGTQLFATVPLGGVFVSNDSGKTWNAPNNGLPTTSVGALLADGDRIYVCDGSNGVFVSVDSGYHWQSAGFNIYATALAKSGENLLIGTPGGGVWISSDSGANWTNASLGSVSVLCFAATGSDLYAGTLGWGAYRSTDHGATWTNIGLASQYFSSTEDAITASGAYIYFGVNGRGVFRSSDDGQSWVPSSTGLTTPYVSSLAAIDSTVYAGAFTDSGGVFRSTDDGKSWSLTPLRGEQIYAVAVDSSKVIAAAPAGTSSNGGLYLSTNKGVIWKKIVDHAMRTVAIGDSNFFAGQFSPYVMLTFRDTVQLSSGGSSGSILTNIGKNVFVGGDWYAGIYRSTDNGFTWNMLTGSTSLGAYTFAMATSGDYLFAGGPSADVYASADLGQNWTDVNSGLTEGVQSMVVHDGYLFIGSTKGQVWRRPIAEITSQFIAAPALVNPEDNATEVPDSATFVWRSVQGAASYRLQISNVITFSSTLFDSSTIADTTYRYYYLSRGRTYFWRVSARNTEVSGPWSSPRKFQTNSDTSQTGPGWHMVDISGGVGTIESMSYHSSILYAAYDGGSGTNMGGLYRSTNLGLTWNAISTGISCPYFSSVTTNGSTILVGTYTDSGGVYKSTNNGETWNPTSLLGQQIYCLAMDSVIALACSPPGNEYSGGLYESTDHGSNWTELVGNPVNWLAIGDSCFYATQFMPSYTTLAYINGEQKHSSGFGGRSIAVIGKRVFVGGFWYSGVHASTDNGATWNLVGDPSTLSTVTALASSGNYLFASVPYAHLYMSGDYGLDWTAVDSGLTDDVRSLMVSNGYLYVGSTNGHIWRRALSEMHPIIDRVGGSGSNVPKKYELLQNYPNPFNPTTTIAFDLKENSFVKITIYNLLGEKVEEYDMGKLGPGEYQKTFDMSYRASGAYFYQITALSESGKLFTSVKKMVLLK